MSRGPGKELNRTEPGRRQQPSSRVTTLVAALSVCAALFSALSPQLDTPLDAVLVSTLVAALMVVAVLTGSLVGSLGRQPAAARRQAGVVQAPRTARPVLWLAVRLLPAADRADWLEEQRGYLADLPSPRGRRAWAVRQLAAMPRYALAVRTGRDKESA